LAANQGKKREKSLVVASQHWRARGGGMLIELWLEGVYGALAALFWCRVFF